MLPRTVWVVLFLACSADDGSDPSAGAPGQGQPSATEPAPLDTLIEHGTELYRRAEFDSVIDLLGPALNEARALGDSTSIAKLLVLEAYVAYQRSDYGKARAIGEAALAIELAIGLSEELARAYNLLGLVAWQQSRFSDAIDLFTKTGECATDDEAGRTLAVINLGNVHTDLGNMAEAKAAFEAGLELSRKRGDARRQSIALNNLGMLSIRVGDPVGAIPFLDEAIRLFRSQGADNFEANALGQIGTAYTALGEIGKAIAVLDSALQLARSKGLRQEEASNLEALAEAYRAAGDHRRALALYADAEAINRQAGLVWEMASDQRSRAQIYDELGDKLGASEAARQALETHRSVGARWEEFADLLLLADLSHQLGGKDGSLGFLDQARDLAVEFDARTSRVELALTEARIAERSGRSQLVLESLDRVELDLSSGPCDWAWAAEALRARAHAALGQLETAAGAGRRAVHAVERVRSGFGSGYLRSRLTSNRREAYTTLVDILLQIGDTLAAFEVSDAARGRTLLEHAWATGTQQPSHLGEAARSERAALLRQISEWNDAITYLESFAPNDRDQTAIRELTERIAKAQAEYEALRVLAIERDTMAAALLGERTVSAHQIQGTLGDGEALVEYLVTEDRMVIFAVTREEVQSYSRPLLEHDLWRRVRIARGFISDPSWDPELESSSLSGLYEFLVAPASSALSGAHRIIFVPDGVLYYLPFATLIDPATDRYLVEDYAVQVLPSASALPALQVRSERGRTGAESSDAIAFAPLSRALPATRTEVEAICKTVSGCQSVVGRRATEAHLRDALSGAGIVHVATHGVMNARNPMFSRLELAATSNDATENDGRLEVHELFTLPVRSRLVFLSGCETGLGTAGSTSFAVGEDYATLAQAFLYAGAANVVSTLWPVEDEGAAAFAALFYQALAVAIPIEALAQAQRQLIVSARYRAPYYWAAYQLAGR